MVFGGIALLVYASACVVAAKRERLPLWLGAGVAWLAWLSVAFGVLGLAKLAGLV